MTVTHLEFKCRIWRLWYTTIAFAGVNVPGMQVGEAYWLLFFDILIILILIIILKSAPRPPLVRARVTWVTSMSQFQGGFFSVSSTCGYPTLQSFVHDWYQGPSWIFIVQCSWYMSCVTVYTYIIIMCLHNIYTWYPQTVGCVDLLRDVKWTGLVPKAGFSSLAPTPELPWTPGKWS